MNFLHEKENQLFLLFLTGLCLLFCCFLIYGGWLGAQQTKNMLVEREQAITSALLEQDMAPSTIALVLNNTTITEEGDILLQQLGHTEQTLFWLWPAVQHVTVSQIAFFLSGGLLLSVCLLFSAVCYLQRRERIYQKAIVIVSQFAEGDYSCHLPRNQRGTLYQLFAQVNQLSMALQAKSETERQAKDFLKHTISDISHQLKTPLAALTMYTEIILAEPDQPETITMFSQKSMQSLNRMEQLIQTLLKMTRLDSGNIIFERNRYQISELLTRATAELLTRAEQENKQILWKPDDLDTTIFCDLEWTSEAIGNLVKNALDHTAAGGVIQINWQQSPTLLRLSIADNGCGIAAEDFHHIFKRFYRSKRSSDRQGAGLGLPLAKAIIEGQGGMISVQSELNIGTTFLISFLTDL